LLVGTLVGDLVEFAVDNVVDDADVVSVSPRKSIFVQVSSSSWFVDERAIPRRRRRFQIGPGSRALAVPRMFRRSCFDMAILDGVNKNNSRVDKGEKKMA
jgi:hypothetical protein